MANLNNITVEPCSVEWNGSDFGYTQGDIEISPEEQGVEVTAHQEGTNVLDMIRTGKTLEITVSLIETATSRLRELVEVGGGVSDSVAQIATLLCVADVASSLHGKTFQLFAQDGGKFLFQLKEASTALAAPVITGWTVSQISFTADDSANSIADAVAAAIDFFPEFVAPNPAAATVEITWADSGAVPSGSGVGNSGFTLVVGTPGSSGLSGWGGSKDFSGMLANAAKLVFHPTSREVDDLSADIAVWKAYPMVGSIVKSGENLQTISITFKVFPDLNKPKAVRLFVVGDHS